MLSISLHRGVPRPRARLLGLAAFTWMVWMPAALAAEAVPPEQAAPFKHYQGWRDEPPEDWRQANDRVGEIGGWRTYLREAQQDGGGSDDAHAHHGH
jgi:hypothetical protein